MGGDQAYTPLNVPLREILMQITNDTSLRWLGKIKTTLERRSHDKYYDFHQDHRHTTEACYELRQQIKLLLSQGKLRQYILDKGTFQPPRRRQGWNGVPPPRGTGPNPPPPSLPLPPPKGEVNIIHIIVEGFSAGGPSSSRRKVYTREAYQH